MAAKKQRRSKKTSGRPGTGPRGLQGKTGPAGRPGRNHTAEIAILAAQVATLIKELQTQLIRIGQLQAQLDRVASGHSPQPEPPSPETEH
jgi:hypothetical protein